MKLTKVYWCLGSNINPEKHIPFAVREMQNKFSDLKSSKLYSCPAVGFEGPDFLNLALSASTQLSLQELLNYADQLEQAAGRVRVERGRFDSRTLDVDLIIYGDLKGKYLGRVWPSSDLDKAAHVLGPIADIAGQDRHPVSGRLFTSLWNEFDKHKKNLTELDFAELE